MNFEDLEFKSHPAKMGGVQAKKEFPNKWEISVIKTTFSYGGDEEFYELAVLKNGYLHYDNPVAGGGVRGYLTPEDVERLGTEVENYEDNNNETPNPEEASERLKETK